MHRAHFPSLKTVDEYDFTFHPGVRLSLLGSALSADFITQGQSVIFSGPSGTGKTHLAIAIAYRAIQNGFDALFTTATALIEDLSAATRAGKLRPVLPTYTHPAVLVIDEVGYLGYGPDAANVLFQVVNDRYLHHRPMIFTTNKPLAAWGRVLHDADLAEALLDRVLQRLGEVFVLKVALACGCFLQAVLLPLGEGERHGYIVVPAPEREDARQHFNFTGDRTVSGTFGAPLDDIVANVALGDVHHPQGTEEWR